MCWQDQYPFFCIHFCNSSYRTNTKEEPMLLQKFDKLPLKKPVTPSVLRILFPQSTVPL